MSRLGRIGNRYSMDPKAGLKRLIIFLIVIAAIITTIFVVLKVKHKKQVSEQLDPIMLFDKTEMDEYKKELASLPSDIDGMTKADKADAGLLTEDGSDSDMDGLTDKEEIEVYKTDPLKASTAGDMYFDGEKIRAGLDPQQKYDTYDEATFGPIQYSTNGCSNVTLFGKTASDRLASVSNVTGNYKRYEGTDLGNWVDKYTPYAEYKFAGFRGDLSIDLTNDLTRAKKTMDDVMILTARGEFDNAAKASCKVEGNTISLSAPDGATIFFVIVADKKTKNPITGLFTKAIGGTIDAMISTSDSGQALVVYSQSANAITKGGIRPKIYYVSSGDEAKDNSMLSTMIALANSALPDIENTTSKDCRKVSLQEYQFRLQLCKSFLGKRHVRPDIGQYYLSYWTYADEMGNYYDETHGGTSPEEMEDFINNAIFPFGNFGSYISPGGNCAGMTSMIATLYNTGSIPPQGSFDFGGEIGEVSYNLTSDPANGTLLNPGLIDYKDKNFVNDKQSKNRVIDNNKLSAGELEFIKAVGCHWGKVNARPKAQDHFAPHGLKSGTVTNMKAAIDSGKVVIVGATMYENKDFYALVDIKKMVIGAHSIILYGYSEHKETDIAGVTRTYTDFYVYDPNLPNNRTTNVFTFEDNGEWVIYDYAPNKLYQMTNFSGVGLEHGNIEGLFSVMDENLNSLIER